MNTAAVSLAVTPTVVSTLFSHYIDRKPRRHKPTAHISYDEGLHLIRSFLTHASRHTVEELQAFTSQWVPNPQWVKVDEVEIPQSELSRAASLLAEQLGHDGIRRVGGKEWWQWRKPGSSGPLKAEWIEMKSDYHERKRNIDPGNRVMLYVHGGAYFFGSVDEHRYQIQRHARKLKARALAPRYRLAPQFPFPCGLQDCLATYLFLLTQQEPSTIILAGDSAGGGMVMSMLVILRDRGVPLPAGAVLISPWVDLTHSFPSVSGDCPLDYIPPSGFHHKPSLAWPPPDEYELRAIKKQAMQQKKDIAADKAGSESNSDAPTLQDVANTTTRLSLLIDGEDVEITEQLQIYTTNELIAHPLVSPVMQPTLGGLPPLLIMVGGGEMLRDEQIYLAHKCAHPEAYLPPDALMDEQAMAQVKKYAPTDVQLQVWDDLCHVAPTLSFTSPAKYMYRSVAQFSAWCLARAQKTHIDIPDDDQISVISKSNSSTQEEPEPNKPKKTKKKEKKSRQNDTETQAEQTTTHIITDQTPTAEQSIGKAGDPLPPFIDHMIRQHVTTHGIAFPLPPASSLPSCTVPRDHVGVIKVGPVRRWLAHKRKWAARFRQSHDRVRRQRLADMAAGSYEVFGEGEVPPPSALAGRRKKLEVAEADKKRVRSLGLALWSGWGSRHDEMTVLREQVADAYHHHRPHHGGAEGVAEEHGNGDGARAFSDIQSQERAAPSHKFARLVGLKKPSRSKRVTDERQVAGDEHVGGDGVVVAVEDPDTAPAMTPGHVGEGGVSGGGGTGGEREAGASLLSPDRAAASGEKGVTGKRVFIEGLATPFSLRGEADTASMITLQPSRPATPGVLGFGETAAAGEGQDERELDDATPSVFATPFLTPGVPTPDDRPGLETFVTAQEVPRPGP